MSRKGKKPNSPQIVDFVDIGRQLTELHEMMPDQFHTVASDAGLSLRKAYYLMEVFAAFGHLHAPRERVLAIGWTKAQLLAKVITESNWHYWLKQAETLAAHELKDLVKGIEPELNKHCVLLYLTAAEFDLMAKVLVHFGAVRNGRYIGGKEEALTAALASLAKGIANDTGK